MSSTFIIQSETSTRRKPDNDDMLTKMHDNMPRTMDKLAHWLSRIGALNSGDVYRRSFLCANALHQIARLIAQHETVHHCLNLVVEWWWNLQRPDTMLHL